MSSKTLFSSTPMVQNLAGGNAYEMSAQHALAQFAVTGCFGDTYYADAKSQLEDVKKLVDKCSPEFIAKVALYARESGHMKDMPAYLLATLAKRDIALCKKIFARVCDNGKMVRNFVQIVRSGACGRKSLGSAPKKLVQAWINGRTDRQLLNDSVGNDPSLCDLIKMVHPKPAIPERRAFYGWLIGKKVELPLPECVQAFERWKADKALKIPDVNFQLLTAGTLTNTDWTDIAVKQSWQTMRMNLNTFARHGVFGTKTVTDLIAAKLVDKEAIAKAHVFPYQLMVAYQNCDEGVPMPVKEALQDAMEFATSLVPAFGCSVAVAPDISGSMSQALTGAHGSATSAVSCKDIAALISACTIRQNKGATVLPFSDRCARLDLNPRDSVMTNAKTMAALPSGGTDCSLPIRWLLQYKATELPDLVILVSDNESWMGNHMGGSTNTMIAWNQYKGINPKAKLVCIDLVPNSTVQAVDRKDIMNIGGFSDQVFTVIKSFVDGEMTKDAWVAAIEKVEV